MQPLDLKDFVWNRNHKHYNIVAITTYKNDDVVVFQERKNHGTIEILSVDEFCREFQATYQISS